VFGGMILKCISEEESVKWIDTVRDSFQLWALVMTVVNIQVP
jgi:hypothetical protein